MIRGPENLRSRHFGIGADAPAGCHGGKSAAAGIFGLDQVHHPRPFAWPGMS